MTGLAEETRVEEVALGPLANSLGLLVRMSKVRIFESFFEALSHYDLKPGEFSVLWIISINPGVRPGAIAQRLLIRPAHMTKLISRLVALGYVTRRVPADDRRAVELFLSEEGERFVAGAKAEFFGYSKDPDGRLTQPEMQQLLTLLRKYVGIEEPKT